MSLDQTDAEKLLSAATPDQFRAATTVAIERLQFMRQNGITFGGARDLYEIFGYDRIITVKQYRDRYARGGIAGRIVDALPKAAWRLGGELVEDEKPERSTEFEKAWDAFNDRLKIWTIFQKAHILARLSTFSVILIGAPGVSWNEELPKATKNDGSQIVYLQPYIGSGGSTNRGASTTSIGQQGFGTVTIDSWDEDPKSTRFGLPLYYRLARTTFGSSNFNDQPIHWSRIIHIAEGTLDDEVFGTPVLERPWNLLDDLDKVTGGGAEAFFLRANQGIHFDIDKDVKDLSPEAKADFREQIEHYKNDISRVIRTRGVKSKPLGSDVADFSGPADTILTQIAGTASIPKRILTGSEMGELASTQDRDNWKDQITGEQTEFCEPYIVKRFVDRMIDYNYLPKPKKYGVAWPVIETLTEQEKVTGAQGWATVNKTQGSPVFTESEIRDKWYGLPPLTSEQIAEEQSRKPQPPVQQQQQVGPDGQPVDPSQNPNQTEDPQNDAGNNPALAAAEQKTIEALALALAHEDPEAVLAVMRA